MWGFESLLPCQAFKGGRGNGYANGSAEDRGLMQEAAKLKEQGIRGGGGGGSAVSSVVEKFGEYPRRLRQFFHEVRNEMRLVNWPSQSDVTSTTVVVIVTVAFFALFFLVVDTSVYTLMERVGKLFK
jgi:preprotein translocase subunit SecE